MKGGQLDQVLSEYQEQTHLLSTWTAKQIRDQVCAQKSHVSFKYLKFFVKIKIKQRYMLKVGTFKNIVFKWYMMK